MAEEEHETLVTSQVIDKDLEPGVITDEILTKVIYDQGYKGEAGRLSRLDRVNFDSVTVIRLEFQSKF